MCEFAFVFSGWSDILLNAASKIQGLSQSRSVIVISIFLLKPCILYTYHDHPLISSQNDLTETVNCNHYLLICIFLCNKLLYCGTTPNKEYCARRGIKNVQESSLIDALVPSFRYEPI